MKTGRPNCTCWFSRIRIKRKIKITPVDALVTRRTSLMGQRFTQGKHETPLDRNPLYEGKIGEAQIHLWRGAYSIHDIRISKTSGNLPVRCAFPTLSSTLPSATPRLRSTSFKFRTKNK